MAYEFTFTPCFQKHFKDLTVQEKKQLKNKLQLLAENPSHPSLRTKRIAESPAPAPITTASAASSFPQSLCTADRSFLKNLRIPCCFIYNLPLRFFMTLDCAILTSSCHTRIIRSSLRGFGVGCQSPLRG